MRRGLLCVLVETGAARCVMPLFERWARRDPGFAWSVAATPSVRDIFAGGPIAAYITAEPLDPNASAFDVAQAAQGAKPSVALVSCSGAAVEHAAVGAASAAGAKTLQFIDNWYGYQRRLALDTGAPLPDRVLVIDEAARREAIAEGVPAQMIVAAGHPGWELISPRAAPASRDLLFLGAPVRRDYGNRLGYTEAEAWEAIKAAATARPDLVGQLRYAPHPQQNRASLPADAEVLNYDATLLDTVATIAGMFSAPLVDAFLAGRRAVTVQPDANGPDMCALSRHGRIPRCRTVGEVIAALEAAPAGPGDLSRALAGSAERFEAEIRAALAA